MTDPALTMTAPSLTRAVYEQLRADILTCRLVPGERLKVAELCTKLGVSLGAVREALAGLAVEGLVAAEAQRGFKVSPVSVSDLEDLSQTRIEIESLCLRNSIANGGLQWEASLVAAMHRLTKTPERVPGDVLRLSDEWSAAHRDFHRALVAGCTSDWLLRLREMLYAQSERYRRLSVPAESKRRDLDAEHRALMEAALDRDANRATRLITEHLNLTTEVLKQFFDKSGGKSRENAKKERMAI